MNEVDTESKPEVRFNFMHLNILRSCRMATAELLSRKKTACIWLQVLKIARKSDP